MAGNDVFATRLKLLRQKKGLTQKELADALGISKASVVSYENALRVPSLDALVSIETFFDVSGSYLRGESDDPRPLVYEDANLLSAKDQGVALLAKNIMDICSDSATPPSVRNDVFDILQTLYSTLRHPEPSTQEEAVARMREFIIMSTRFVSLDGNHVNSME